MKLTRHANSRFQQRGFKKQMLEIILYFGESKRKPGGVIEYSMSNKSKKKIIQAMDKMSNKAVLVDPECERVITVYNKVN